MDFDAASKVLRNRGWLSNLPRAVQDYWLSGAKLQHLSKGETLFNVNDDVHYMFGIAEGVLGAYLSYNPEETRLMMLICEGVWAGDPTVMSSEKRRGMAIARADTTLLIVPKAHVEEVSDRYPEIWRRIASNLVVQFDSFITVSAAAYQRDPTVRLLMTIIGFCRLNVGHDTLEVSAEELGHMAGLSRNAVGKSLAELEEQGLIERGYAAITILDRQAVAHELNARMTA